MERKITRETECEEYKSEKRIKKEVRKDSVGVCE